MANEKEKEALSPTYTDADGKGDGNATMDVSDLDASGENFIKKNGDPEANVKVKQPDNVFIGLTKEELQKIAGDAYWVRVRWILLVLFWVLWFGMLIAAILIIVLAERCPPRPKQEWWQKSPVYQCYPRSFKDTNGDGIGDLNGVKQKLEYLQTDLNVSSVMLNPIYPSVDKDFGYDVVDYTAIHPSMGSMEDFDALKLEMHRLGMKLILDFVPNHTSRNHTWFRQSRNAGDAPDDKYRDFYIWADGVSGGPPNNWMSVVGGSAWTYDDTRGQYYFHQFLPSQPDLNLRNPAVKTELENVLKFWLDKRVDGIRIDAATHLIESNNTADEPASGSGEGYDSLNHTLTTFQPETFQLISEWRELLDSYNKDGDSYRFLIAEVYAHGQSAEAIGNFYEFNGKKVADMPTNMNLIELDEACDAACVKGLVSDWLEAVPAGKSSNWMVGNHDRHRVATRVSDARVNAVTLLQMTLPGTPFPYYGDEIGMVNGDISYADGKDKNMGEADYAAKSRDFERTPMQWTDGANAGFSDADSTWLPVNGDYVDRNVQVQFAHGAGKTNIEVFQSMTLLRKEPSFQWGDFEYGVTDSNIFSFIRQAERFDGYAVIINFGTTRTRVDLANAKPEQVPKSGQIVAHAANFAGHSRAMEYAIGKDISLDSFILDPTEGVVVRWAWDAQNAA